MTAGVRTPIVLMGTPSFSVPFLDALLKSGRDVKAVVTQPDKPKGRGQRLMPSPVKEFAQKQNITILQPTRLSEPLFVETIKEINPVYIVVVAYGRIIPSVILRIPEKGCINVHASLLPDYRGASPIQWAIIKGSTCTGVTTMMMSETLDTGDILLQEKVKIDITDSAGSLSRKLSDIGVPLLIKTLNGLDRCDITPQPQHHDEASYAPLLKKEDGLIDWQDKSENIYNRIRGFNPWPGAYTFYKGNRWSIWKAIIIESHLSANKPGEIIEINHDGIIVVTGDSVLKITEIQIAGKKKMAMEEFLRGYKVETGVILKKEDGNKESVVI